MCHRHDRPFSGTGDEVLRYQTGAGMPIVRNADAHRAFANHVCIGNDIAPEATPADRQTHRCGAFDCVSANRRIGFNGNALTALINRLVRAPKQVADEVALDNGKAAAFIEIRH